MGDWPDAVYSGPDLWIKDTLFGAASMCFLIHYSEVARGVDAGRIRSPLMLRLLDSPCATGLGAFSYSLYLVHVPMIFVALKSARLLHIHSVGAIIIGFWLIGLPLVLFLAYRFHLIFERPFMSSVARPVRQDRNIVELL
jgi:peptidoglycan/LPS O-acetylase OafA/YrhL